MFTSLGDRASRSSRRVIVQADFIWDTVGDTDNQKIPMSKDTQRYTLSLSGQTFLFSKAPSSIYKFFMLSQLGPAAVEGPNGVHWCNR